MQTRLPCPCDWKTLSFSCSNTVVQFLVRRLTVTSTARPLRDSPIITGLGAAAYSQWMEHWSSSVNLDSPTRRGWTV